VWGEREVPTGLVGESERKNHWEDRGISVRIILKWILKTCEGFDCINLAQDRDKWRAVVNMVMNPRAP
jgi:hypothetical protein